MAKRTRHPHTFSQPPATTREVLVIDNGPLRQRSFLETQKVIQKIERLEEKIRSFHTSDQKLFTQWMDLTFRDHRTRHEKAQSKYLELARFHNWVVATARKLKIEMPVAYKLMQNEQIRWNNGSEEERQKIALARAERDAYIRDQSRSRYNDSFSFDDESEGDSVDGGIDGLDEILNKIEDMVLDPESESLTQADERIDRIIAMSDDSLKAALEMQETSFMLFDVSLNWGQVHRDYSLFKRIWLLMSNEQKDFYARVFASVAESPIEEFLQQIGLSEDWTESTSEEDEDAFEFNENFKEEAPARPKKTAPAAEASSEERLKSTFRKLMRKLHPDVHASESQDGRQPSWVQRMWNLVQKAYNERNTSSLDRLLKLTLIRMNVLEELTISEIAEAKHWLKQDFEALEEEAASLKNSLAWGFSGKKNYDSLTRKIEKEFARDLRLVMDEIETLEQEHHLLEILSRQERRYQQRPRGSNRGRSRGRTRSHF